MIFFELQKINAKKMLDKKIKTNYYYAYKDGLDYGIKDYLKVAKKI